MALWGVQVADIRDTPGFVGVKNMYAKPVPIPVSRMPETDKWIAKLRRISQAPSGSSK